MRELFKSGLKKNLKDLSPFANVKWDESTQHWISTSPNPQFMLNGPFERGSYEIYLEFNRSMHQQVRVYYEGPKFFELDFTGGKPARFFLSMDAPHLRIDPIPQRDKFKIKNFELKRVSLPLLALSAFQAISDEKADRAIMQKDKLSRIAGFSFKNLPRSKSDLKKLIIEHNKTKLGSDRESIYHRWRKLNRADEKSIRALKQGLPSEFDFDILIYHNEQSEDALSKTIDSIRQQNYGRLKITILSKNAEIGTNEKVLRPEQFSILEKKKNHLVLILFSGDLLEQTALLESASYYLKSDRTPLFYSDHDHYSTDLTLKVPFFKPDWSPEYQLDAQYVGRNLFLSAAWLSERLEVLALDNPAAEILRFAEKNEVRVGHVPNILFHIPEESFTPPKDNIEIQLTENPLVSIVIPTASREYKSPERCFWLIDNCLESIEKRSTYKNLEFVIIDNNDMPKELYHKIQRYDPKVIHYSDEFNLSRKMNLGVEAARGQHVILLNDDIEIISEDWVEQLLFYSLKDSVGAVGAKLLFPNQTVQHTGVLFIDQKPSHPSYAASNDDPGYFGSNIAVRNFSAVTGACLAVKRDLYLGVGGFSEDLYLNYNDVDFCLKLLDKGFRNLCNPNAQLIHYESLSKSGTSEEELKKLRLRWTDFNEDPYSNPNLTHNFEIETRWPTIRYT